MLWSVIKPGFKETGMYAFFDLVERTGLAERRVAAVMGISSDHFSRAKLGKVPVTAKFQRQAVNALDLLGIRDADGNKLTAATLFIAASEDSELSNSVIEVAL